MGRVAAAAPPERNGGNRASTIDSRTPCAPSGWTVHAPISPPRRVSGRGIRRRRAHRRARSSCRHFRPPARRRYFRGLMGDINPRAADYAEYREAVRELCARSTAATGRRSKRDAAYPEAFVTALTDAGWLAALIPTEYGGGGLSVTEASVILEEINRSGATRARATRRCTSWARCCGTAPTEQKRRTSRDRARRAAAAVVRASPSRRRAPTRRRLTTFAERRGDRYVVNGQKVWISRVQHSDLMLLLARTTPLDRGDAEDRRPVRLPGRPARRRADAA